MKYFYGDVIKEHLGSKCNICITTNGYVTKAGDCTMGRGIALQIRNRIKNFGLLLGQAIHDNGNITQYITKYNDTNLIAFPVKPGKARLNIDIGLDNVVPHMRNKCKAGGTVPGWAVVAQPHIIKQSYYKLVGMADEKPDEIFYLPKPGCGAGCLKWSDVKPLLAPERENIVICDFKSSSREHEIAKIRSTLEDISKG